MPVLSEETLKSFLEAHPDWSLENGQLVRTFRLADFVGSIGFVSKVAMLAEKADHHPDIDIRWNRVTLSLSTHSAGGITEKDTHLADACGRLA
jgi:4a-hydroxytetrahydrobiopterin dehydratase